MKKILLITVLGTLFAAGSAFAHCGACGAGDKAHGDAAKVECAAECAKACCAKKADCSKDKAECAKDKAECAKDKADETAAAKAPACCPATKAGKPA